MDSILFIELGHSLRIVEKCTQIKKKLFCLKKNKKTPKLIFFNAKELPYVNEVKWWYSFTRKRDGIFFFYFIDNISKIHFLVDHFVSSFEIKKSWLCVWIVLMNPLQIMMIFDHLVSILQFSWYKIWKYATRKDRKVFVVFGGYIQNTISGFICIFLINE